MLGVWREVNAAKRIFLKRGKINLLLLLCLTGVARVQTAGGSVHISGTVSGTVAISIPSAEAVSDSGVRVTSRQGCEAHGHDPARACAQTGYRLGILSVLEQIIRAPVSL